MSNPTSTALIPYNTPISAIELTPLSNHTNQVSSSKPLNGDEIIEALQPEAIFTIATDKKPVVTTFGCGPCVALGGYDSINKIAFIVHFSNANEVIKSGNAILYNINRLAKKKIETPIQLHLRRGIKGYSEATVEEIKIWMKKRNNLPMEISSKDILSSWVYEKPKTLSIDSRNGKVSEYNPKDNPKHRQMTELDSLVALWSAYSPQITVHYRPEI